MPANLTPEYFHAERKYRAASNSEEKMIYLKEMLAVMPKHKGTDKLQAELRAKISKLNKQMQKKSSTRRAEPIYQVDKEGAGQLILVGMPNVGKSRLISELTNAESKFSDYPFATMKPIVGMVDFEDTKIQIVDTPSVSPEFTVKWLPQLVKEGNAILLVVDLGREDILGQVEYLRGVLRDKNIFLGKEEMDDIFHKSCMLVGNKDDLDEGGEKFKILEELYGEEFPAVSVSAQKGEFADFRKACFTLLQVIRVYTKMPGEIWKKGDPFILKAGSTVQEAAAFVHKDFKNLKFARLWDGEKYNGLRVERAYVLKDKDLVEFHL